jgi:two-component system LytT family response regulator
VTPEVIHVLIVDDEEHALKRLRELLAEHPDITIVRECRGGRDAVEVLSKTPIDLVFLDVQMPDLGGFGVVEEIGVHRMPPVIFVSAFSEFAVRAFEAYAVDYLLKPFDDARFDTALTRARDELSVRQSKSRDGENENARLSGLLEHVQHAPDKAYPEAIAIKAGDNYVVTRVADIDWAEADGNYVKLHFQKRARLLKRSLASLEQELLDPEVFLRVHRSAIVNTTKIASVEPLFHGELSLVLQDGSRVQCSRRFRKRLESKLFFTS